MNIEKRKISSVLETDKEMSLMDSVRKKIITRLNNDIDKAIIEVLQELKLCEQGKEIEFLTNNKCFEINGSYYLTYDKRKFHLFNITKPSFSLQNNIVNDSINVNASIILEKIAKEIINNESIY